MKYKKKRKKRGAPQLVAEQAAAYGVTLPTASNPGERFLSPNEIGNILNLTGEAIKQWIYQRRLPAVKLANGYWRVRVSDFEAYLKARHEGGRRRVLITQNPEKEMTEVVKAVEGLGHQPLTAHNYADALLKALDHHPALFVINCSAADSEPWRLAEKIRETKALRTTPILLVSDDELSELDADRALKLGAQGFLKLPLSAAVLTQEIRRILDRSL